MTNESEKPAVTKETTAAQPPTTPAVATEKEALSDDDLDEVAGGQTCGGRGVKS